MNKNLTQLGQQLLGIWKQLGLNQRISIILATGVVCAGLGTMAFWSSRTDYALLYGKLEEGEASKVIAALDEAKVPYQIRGRRLDLRAGGQGVSSADADGRQGHSARGRGGFRDF